MDLNDDGNPDMITGEYWPGDIYAFMGKSDGTFEAMQSLKDDTGRNLNGGDEWESERKPNMKSLAAAPYATDWDGDGDLDMLIGNIEGTVTLLKNIGSRSEPLFSSDRELLTSTAGEIKVNGDSGPVFEDWDADGLRDLVVGAGDGAVVWYKNIGDAKEPKFEAQRSLLAASSLGHEGVPHGEEPASHGTRVKVNVVDYDGDGLVDLLLGDFLSQANAPLELTEAQESRKAEVKAKVESYQERFQELYEEFAKAGDVSSDPDEMQKVMEELQKQAYPDGDINELMQEYSELTSTSKYHGFVWLYKRVTTSTNVASLPN